MEKIKETRALRFELSHDNNEYGHEFDEIPANLYEEGFFDDNGDLCEGDCALIPIDDNFKNTEGYEIVDVEIIDTTENTEDFDSDDEEKWIEEHEDFMYWSSRNILIQQI